jgi:uncharacterized protein (TIGR03084 family)
MTALNEVIDDLAAEHAALDVVLVRLEAATWDRPTHAPGWLVRDQVTHLAQVDEAALRAIADADRFRAEVTARAGTDRKAREAALLAKGRAMSPTALLDWWRTARAALLAAAPALSPTARVPWYGPEMSSASFITARLMETWAHGLDVVDVVGIERPDTDRLRHVAFIGARARPFSYTTRGLTPNSAPVLIRLTLPSGVPWTFGEGDLPDRIEGTAVDFCRVVTQRRHVADTSLRVRGSNAAEWMTIAQAFAGPPGVGRRPGEFAAGNAAR